MYTVTIPARGLPLTDALSQGKGLCFWGHGALRRFYIDHSDHKSDYGHPFRENSVSSDITQIDHTMKVFMKVKVKLSRLVGWLVAHTSGCGLTSFFFLLFTLARPFLVLDLSVP